MKREEEALQRGIVAYLNAVLTDAYRAFAIPNGGKRDAREAARMKAAGTLAGVPDLQIVGPGGKCWFIEVKTPDGRLSPPQRDFQHFCIVRGVPCMIARSIDDVKMALAQWRVATREAA